MVENKIICPYCDSAKTFIARSEKRFSYDKKVFGYRYVCFCDNCKRSFISETEIEAIKFKDKSIKHYHLINLLFSKGG